MLEEPVEDRQWQEAARGRGGDCGGAEQPGSACSLQAGLKAPQPEPATPYPSESRRGGSGSAWPCPPSGATRLPRSRTRTAPLPVAKPSTRTPGVAATGPQPLPKRFLLWIDGVGGYLVCLNCASPSARRPPRPVDVPLLADLSRLHAELARDPEGYVLESSREVLVNGAPTPRTVLKPGDRLTLGPTCQFIFHQPVPISPSARLELVSGHRLPLAVDGVILMAEAADPGPGRAGARAVARGCRRQRGVVSFEGGPRRPLLRRFRVDNKPCQDRCDLPLPSVVTADSFTFALEPVGPRL